MMLLDDPCELAAWNKLQKLRPHTATLRYGRSFLLRLWSCSRAHSGGTGMGRSPRQSEVKSDRLFWTATVASRIGADRL